MNNSYSVKMRIFWSLYIRPYFNLRNSNIYYETKILQVNCMNESKCFKESDISIWRNFLQSLHRIYIFLKYQFNKIYIEKGTFLRLLNLYLRSQCLSGKIFIEHVLVLKGFDWWMLRGMFPWHVLNICARQ